MGSRLRSPVMLSLFSLILLGFGSLHDAIGAGSGPQSRHASGNAVTVEPTPPLTLDIRLKGLQKYSRGGVATILVEAASDVDLDSVDISLRLPDKVSFTDGTRARKWDRALARGGKVVLPADLLVGEDGAYTLSAEATATYRGMPVHRGFAFTLSAGAPERKLSVRDGAIEYPGVPGGEVK